MIGVPKKIYTESHHIFPKSIFGDNKYIVELTAREHFVAHHLLWKYYKKKYGNKDKKTINMAHAYWRMANDDQHRITSRQFEILRHYYAELQRANFLGENNPFFGRKHTKETLEKISLNRTR